MKGIQKLKAAYLIAKGKKVGETCTCPSCGTEFQKHSYQQAFCISKPGTVCKDFYWNNVTPSKRNNTTRISPASKKWTQISRRDEAIDYDDDPSWDAHKH